MIRINTKKIGKSSKCYIIAEAGVNHNCDLIIAKKLIDTAADAEEDAIKFHTFKTENLVMKETNKAQFQLEATDRAESIVSH